MSRAVILGALLVAASVGTLVMWAIGGSRRVSHVTSLAFTWIAPAFGAAFVGAAIGLRPGPVAGVVVYGAWSVVGAVVLGYYAGRLSGRLPVQRPPGSEDRD
jgi:hypothetical protein